MSPAAPNYPLISPRGLGSGIARKTTQSGATIPAARAALTVTTQRARERLGPTSVSVTMNRAFPLLVAVAALSACAGPRLPAPNSAFAEYDARDHSLHVMVSGLQPASNVALVGPDGMRYPAAGFSVISGPHVLYNPPPSIGFGVGGFGFTGCCSAIGSGIGWRTGRQPYGR
jgi:hypothetical protein